MVCGKEIQWQGRKTYRVAKSNRFRPVQTASETGQRGCWLPYLRLVDSPWSGRSWLGQRARVAGLRTLPSTQNKTGGSWMPGNPKVGPDMKILRTS
jgi:hypothetical protein